MTDNKIAKNKAIENFRMEQMEIAKELCPDENCDSKINFKIVSKRSNTNSKKNIYK